MGPTTLSGIIIFIITIACLSVVVILFKKGLQRTSLPIGLQKNSVLRTVLFIAAWLVLTGVLAYFQVFTAVSFPPRPMFTVLAGLIILFSLSYTRLIRSVLKSTPLHWLIYFQSFRILVELWFWYSHQHNVFPLIMTFEGENWDIIAGTLALPAGILISRFASLGKRIAIVYNITGIIILAKTLFTAAASMPSAIQRYPFDERLLLLGHFPFIYLPAVLVVLALGFHLLSLRQIYLTRGLQQKDQKLNISPSF